MLVVATSAHASHVGLSRLSAARATPGALIRSCLLQRLGLEGRTRASDVRGKRVEVDCGCVPACVRGPCHLVVKSRFERVRLCK
jgi:hypothetical protein